MKRGILDDRSLTLVRKEFDRLKGSNGYSEYEIGEYIDSGGYARVYAVNPLRGNGEKYALRISDVSSDENNGKNERETEAVKRLMARGQKHIVYFLMNFTVETTYGEERHTLYCTLMPFLCSLLKYENKADDIEIAVRLGNDLLPLLQTCMEKQIIHRDIKSGNILYDGDFRNEAGFVLGDFGEARTDVNGTVTDIGTWATVSPEIAGFDREIRRFHKLCDMYSLGLVMYYYLNGRVYPYGNEKKDFLERLDTKGALPPPKYGSPALKAVIVKATQYYPKDRFASPAEMLAALKKCEEYKTFILGKVSGDEETANPRDALIAENQRLRRELAEREMRLQARVASLQRQMEQLKQQKAAPADSVDWDAAPEKPMQAPRGRRELRASDSANRNAAPEKPMQAPRGRRPSVMTDKPFSVKAGDRLPFGQYPQGANGETEPLVWRVLDVQDGKALLITEKVIDCVKYHTTRSEVDWTNSSLRSWLNGAFVSKAFDDTEQKRIAASERQSTGSPSRGTKGESAVRDRVFALSVYEADKYFLNDDDRNAAATPYAKKRGCYTSRFNNGCWWLCSPGKDKTFAAYVSSIGYVFRFGSPVDLHNVAVRPALWLNLE